MINTIINIIYNWFKDRNISVPNKSVPPVVNTPENRIMDTDNRFGKNTVAVNPPMNLNQSDFNFGANHTWIMFQLAMFKLYKEDRLLDFDDLFISIYKNIEQLSASVDNLKKWNEEYIEYLQFKNDEDNLLEGI